jgi:hypothetical protein
MRYGNPKTASRNMMRGFLLTRDGGGCALGSFEDDDDSVEIFISSGGIGWPRNLAIATRMYRIRVYIPSIEPRVSRRFPNCSAIC